MKPEVYRDLAKYRLVDSGLRRLAVDLTAGPQDVVVEGVTGGESRSGFRAVFSFPLDHGLERLLSFLGQAGALVLAGFSLPERIAAGWTSRDQLPKDKYNSLLQMVYDTRCYAGAAALRQAPAIEFAGLKSSLRGPKLFRQDRCAVLLLSGGLDSAIAALKLKESGYNVVLLHVAGGNLDASDENKSACELARRLGMALEIVHFEWRDMKEIGRKFGRTIFDRYPLVNSIPFGRDLVLFALAAWVAVRYQASHICLAHEFDIWGRPPVFHQGREVYRSELASERACTVIHEILSKELLPGVGLFSPIAPMTKYRVFHDAIKHDPDLLSTLSSCYWGSWCGECPKCMTYGILQEEYGLKAIPFRRDPLEAFGALESLFQPEVTEPQMLHPGEARLPRFHQKSPIICGAMREPLGQATNVALATLLEQNRLPEGPAFERFRHCVYPRLRGRVDEIRQDLLRPRKVALLPDGFSVGG